MTLRKALLCVVFLLAGCVPTIPHGIGVVYDKETFEALRPGEVTRADVLLTIGEPRYRFEENRFFIYEWDMVVAWVYFPYGLPFPLRVPDYLCLEFAPDSFLLCKEHLRWSLYGKPEKAIQKCTHMNQPKKTP